MGTLFFKLASVNSEGYPWNIRDDVLPGLLTKSAYLKNVSIWDKCLRIIVN